MGHAILSPSSHARWSACPAGAQPEREPSTSPDALAGTAAHKLAEVCLTEPHLTPESFLGTQYSERHDTFLTGTDASVVAGMKCTEEMVEAVQHYLAFVRGLAQTGTLHVEMKVPIGELTGEENAEGTADAVVMHDDEGLTVVDLKYGHNPKSPVENGQLLMYAAGLVERSFGLLNPDRVTLVIAQPRVSKEFPAWTVPPGYLAEFIASTREAAKRAWEALQFATGEEPAEYFNPGVAQCRWCWRRSTCNALAEAIEKEVKAPAVPLEAFDDLDAPQSVAGDVLVAELSRRMGLTSLAEVWIKAVRGKVFELLSAGTDVPGWKLVPGREGQRRWDNPDEVVALLQAKRCKAAVMYDKVLRSPTQFEKHAPKNLWAAVADRVVRNPASLHVAPADDERESTTPTKVVDVEGWF